VRNGVNVEPNRNRLAQANQGGSSV